MLASLKRVLALEAVNGGQMGIGPPLGLEVISPTRPLPVAGPLAQASSNRIDEPGTVAYMSRGWHSRGRVGLVRLLRAGGMVRAAVPMPGYPDAGRRGMDAVAWALSRLD